MNPVDVWQQYAADLANIVAPQIGAAGLQLWQGLSLIVVVWTGIQMALSGGINMTAVVRMLMTLAIPLGMLRFYATPLPWPGVSLSVPDVISGMGHWLHGVIVADAGENMFTAIRGVLSGMFDNLMLNAAVPDVGVFELWSAIMSAIFSGLLGLALWLVMIVVIAVVYAVGLAQVVWAQLAITLAILLGPIFIPFLVMPPLSFLFWGWFKTLLTYSLYAAIAAAVFRVSTQVGVEVLNGLVAPGPYLTAAGAGTLLQNFLMTMLYGVAALMASLQVGQFAGMLLSGSGTVASGVGTRALQGARMTATKGVV